MADYMVANGTESQVSNINAGGIDVPASSVRTATLSDAELAAVCALAGVAVMKVSSTYEARRKAAKVLKYRKNATGAAL